MTTIFMGPGLNQDAPLYEPKAVEMPFAWKLSLALPKIGVSVQAFQPLIDGERSVPNGFFQLVALKEEPDELAALIKEKCGTNVQFAQLAMPRGVTAVGFENCGGIWMRRLVDYLVASDSFVQRWDVLVRTK